MILTELTLHNFGVYRGRHTLTLAPESPDRPIVLIGALNGSGKTTLLDGLLLALYGKFAQTSNRGAKAYSDYLRDTINRHVRAEDGASLEVEFLHQGENGREVIRASRTWSSTGKGIREHLQVFRDGEFDQALSDRWQEFIEGLIPTEIARLFFFDGEQIESFATPESASELLRQGIHALLGLDVVDQLGRDLLTVLSRRKSFHREVDTSILAGIETEVKQLEDMRAGLRQKLGETENKIDRFLKTVDERRREYERLGGGLLNRKDEIARQVAGIREKVQDADTRLRDLAGGPAPFLMVRALLSQAKQQAARETEVRRYREAKEILAQRDKMLVDQLKSQRASPQTIKAIQKFLERDLASRDQDACVDEFLNISLDAFSGVEDATLVLVLGQVTEELRALEEFKEREVTAQREFTAIPEPEALKSTADALDAATSELRRAEVEKEALLLRLNDTHVLLETAENKRIRLLQDAHSAALTHETDNRFVRTAGKARESLAAFRKKIVLRHLGRLEVSIYESLSTLLRKPDLIGQITIDPETYNISLLSPRGENIPPARLSAGERQLFAVSMLWGLAKASGRPLPAVVDTPLGRLDSQHRKHLVERYFPNSSHQVLLLSTDEEIVGATHAALKKYISREFIIEYDSANGTSRISTGYFGEEAA